MYVLKLSTIQENETIIKKSVDILNNGGIIAIPTDTVYGFAALASNEKAIERLYKVKEREKNKSIAVLLGDSAQAKLVTDDFSQSADRITQKFWPGGLTVIVKKRNGLPPNISQQDTIGIRIPDHEFVRTLICVSGPLAVTSANHSGLPPATSVSEFENALGDQLDLIVDGGKTAGGIPSTVVDCTTSPIKILREGIIPSEELLCE